MKLLRILLALCLTILLLLPAAGETEHPGDFLYMINVGKGDAILISASDKYYLIDTGKAGAWEAVESALERFQVNQLEGVFLTHTDKDHCGGLKKLVKSGIAVSRWYASAFYTCDPSDHPMVKALKKTDAEITFLQSGDSVDGLFSVIGPLYRDSENDDNNSLVMLFDNTLTRVLLAGDMESREEYALLTNGAFPTCDVFKVPNHADDDVCLYMDLGALGAKYALISTDPYDKPGTPDPLLVSRLEKAGMEVWSTHLSENGILVALGDSIAVTSD